MPSKLQKTLKSIFWSFVVIAMVAGTVLAFQEQQNIRDFFDARDFDASEEIIEVVDHMYLTPTGERLFLATHPTIQTGDAFNESCRKAETTKTGHMLGCFSNDKIHLFAVTDHRISNVVQVTAVHELLHAAYKRIPQREREALAKQLTDHYDKKLIEDPAFEERMSVYEHLSASRFANELHSVFATEEEVIPEWLEEHYALWLADRWAIIDYFQQYREVFEEVQQQAMSLNRQLEDMHDQINSDSDSYIDAVETFNSDWERFLGRNGDGGFSDQKREFYRIKAEFEERRTTLDTWKRRIEANIEAYNELRDELADLGELSVELDSQIDSTVPEVL